MFREYRAYRIIPILFIAIITLGCASVNSKPFVEFDNAAKEASTGIDSALSANYDWTRSGFIERFSADPNSKFSQLIIEVGKNYNWSMKNAPIYLNIKKDRAALSDLNNAFTEYADLLVKLSGGDLVSTDTFDQLAKDLNTNATSASEALNMSTTPTGIALFSTAASESARLYIEHKRQHYLVDILKKNQKNVEAYSDLCIQLIRTIRGTLKTYYVDKYTPIGIAWESSSGEKRQKQTEAMLTLNEQFTNDLAILQELEKTYSSIPKAHADLTKAIKNSKLDLEGIKELYSSGKRLQRLYVELKNSDTSNQ